MAHETQHITDKHLTEVADTTFMVGDRVYHVHSDSWTGTVVGVGVGDLGPMCQIQWDAPASVTCWWYPVADLDYWTRPEGGAVARCEHCGCSKADVHMLAADNGGCLDPICCEVL